MRIRLSLMVALIAACHPDKGETSAGSAGKCEDLTDEASCNSAVQAESECQWVDVQHIDPNGCALEPSAARCIEVSINDGGCSSCLFKDIGGGQFEGVVLSMGHGSCQFNAEFSSCQGIDGEDPPVCACICP